VNFSVDDFSPTGNPCDPDERGILIGVGSQFTIHDLGEGRVVKIPNSIDGSRLFVGGWGPHLTGKKHIPLEETAIYRGVCTPHVLRLAARYPRLSAALGQPRALPGMCFTQDKVRPLVDVIPTAKPDEIRDYIDGYADVCLLCWRYGVHEYILNFGMNNGLDAKNRVVLVDFGEAAFDTTHVERMVERLHWETNSLWVEKFLPVEFHDHYFRAMKSRLSGRSFELHWASDLDELDRMVIRKPALCERIEEIPTLIEQILARANREEGWDISGISTEVLSLFRQYKWKGSGVELQNVLYRAAEACRGTVIQLDDVPPYVHEKVEGEQKNG